MGCEYGREWVGRLNGKEMHLSGEGFEELCRRGSHGEDLQESNSDIRRKTQEKIARKRDGQVRMRNIATHER